jgi:YgiT-type zinc finger domain-containing protein
MVSPEFKQRRVEGRYEDEENSPMKCVTCGASMRSVRTDLPFKTTEHTIVILRNLPVFQCENCAQYLIEDPVLGRVDEILAATNGAAELQVIRYAA